MAKKAPKGYFYNVRGLLVKKLDAATIKAIKERFPNKEFDFDTFKYGVPQTDPIIDQLRNMDPARIATVKKRRSKEDYKAKRRVQESKYYRTNRERILQNLKEKYRSDQTIGDTGKTLKQLTKEKNIKKIVRLQKEKGIFPNGYGVSGKRNFYKPELALWHSLYRAAKDGDGRWTLEKKFFDNVPINEQGNKSWATNNYYKKIKFTDTATGETIKLDSTIKGKGKTLKEYLDTTISKETGNKNVFDKATSSFELKNKLKDTTILYKGQKESLGGLLGKVGFEKTGEKIYSPFDVHHPSGVKNNWWDSEVVFRDANRQLNYIDSKLQRDFKNAKDATSQNKIISDASKKINRLPGGISYIFEGQQLGTNIPTEESITKAAATTYKDRGVTRAVNLFFNNARSDAVTGGQICELPMIKGKASGGSALKCVDAVEDAIQNNPQKLAQEASKIGKFKQAATGFLGFLKSPGVKTFGAGAVVGAAIGLVKEFRNDDVTSYLSNEDQQKSMLVDMATQPIAPDFERPSILDYQLPAVGASLAASTALGAPSTIQASRDPDSLPQFRSRGKGVEQKGLIRTGGRVLGRGLGIAASPGVLAPLAAMDITNQIAEGDSAADIATNPFNYTYPLFAEQTDKFTRGLNPTFRKVARLGMSKPALRLLSRAGIGGLAASLAIQGIGLLDD